ncbi:MAG: UbiD family decarboxylase [Hyphomicrobiales bacterium]|nr:UbiD family decarboxylase [Hyphomicrobiales bacterium]
MLNPDVSTVRPGSNERLPDVRDIVDYAARIGQLARIDGADWNLEIGVLAEIFAHSSPGRSPAVLFDRIKDYPPGMRIVSGLHNSCRRLAYSFGFPDSDDATTLVMAYRNRMKNDFKLIPPVIVTAGPILENVDRDSAVDLFKFPVPMIHEKDGGRYIGTYCVVIMRDPDTGWVNLGTYRTVAHDGQTAGVWMSPGKHGRLIREKYFKQGKPCPALICCGLDPVLFLAGSHEIKHGTSEYAYAGGHRGRPYETIASELYGLPMPRSSWRVSSSPRRPVRRDRSASSLATMPAMCATSQRCGCAGSIIATIQFSPWHPRCGHRPTCRLPSASCNRA